jgi:hypothetical protein
MVRAALRDRTRKFTSIPLTQSRLEVLMSAMAEKQLIMLKHVDQTLGASWVHWLQPKVLRPQGTHERPGAGEQLLSVEV